MSETNSSDLNQPEEVWVPPGGLELFRWPLPNLRLFDRILIRNLVRAARRYVVSVSGIEHVSQGHDPFVLAANHATKPEAIYLPALLILLRRGHLVHFMGDWNFRLFPGINLLYRRFGVITVSHKPCPNRALNRLKPLYADPLGPFRRARKVLGEGRPIGIFPEGVVNRADHLLSGHPGAALLSLRSGAPVVPVGIIPVPDANDRGRPGIAIRIGEPMDPRAAGHTTSTRAAIVEWHAVIMTRIAELSGRSWSPDAEDLPPSKTD